MENKRVFNIGIGNWEDWKKYDIKNIDPKDINFIQPLQGDKLEIVFKENDYGIATKKYFNYTFGYYTEVFLR